MAIFTPEGIWWLPQGLEPRSPGNVVNTELPGPEAARAEAECAACGGEWLEAQLWRDSGFIRLDYVEI